MGEKVRGKCCSINKMSVEKIDDKRYGEITKYKCEFCRNDYSNQRELQEHMKQEHRTSR
jgi:hypothetical protein